MQRIETARHQVKVVDQAIEALQKDASQDQMSRQLDDHDAEQKEPHHTPSASDILTYFSGELPYFE
jgi:hypothetical protein